MTPAPLPTQCWLDGIDMDDDCACGSPLQKLAESIDGMARQLLTASNKDPHVRAFIERAFADTLTGDGLAIILRREVNALGKKQTEAFKPQGFDLAVKGDLKRPIDYQCAKDIKPRPVDWLMIGFIARGILSLLAGAGGLGKSYMVCDLLARLSVGARLPDGTGNAPMRCLYLSREDDPACTLLPRLAAAGADLSLITISTLADAGTGMPLDLTEQVPRIIEDAKANAWGCIVVDTFAAFAPIGSDANAAGDVRVLLNACQRLAAASGAAVLVIAHTRKGGAGDGPAVDAVAGSTQMAAGVRCVALLEPGQEEGQRWLRVVKSNLAPPRHPGGYTWTLTDSKDGGKTPAIAWAVADAEVAEAATMAKAGRSCIPPDALRAALLDVVAKGPLHQDDATDAAWRKLSGKATGAPPRKADVRAAMVELLRDLGEGLELRIGQRGVKMLGIPGTFPPTPEELARTLARPGMTVTELQNRAGCRRDVARDALATVNGSRPQSEVGTATALPSTDSTG